ncbi:MAG: DUF3604 domain-containing protein [Pseudomonadales bacterium]
MRNSERAGVMVMLLALLGCTPEEAPSPPANPAANAATSAADTSTATVTRNPQRDAYYGDLHVHTTYSFDAFIFGTRTTPDDAYQYAKGEAIQHPAGFEMKGSAALDFQAVTDHGIYLGMLPAMNDPESKAGRHEISVAIREAKTAADRRTAFGRVIGLLRGDVTDDLFDIEVSKAAWSEIVDSAERHNEPGVFTTFIGYEYTSSGPAFENLHRNVIYRGGRAPDMPFTASMSTNPEDLWNWMDAERASGRELLAIPHNSNGSNGWMFRPGRFDGSPMDADYADQRMRNEPLVELTQVKGTSETHPALSPNDEWADFEIMPLRIASDLPSQPDGSYVRQALQRGLQYQDTEGFNPFRFGFIGSSDTHNGAGSFEEYNYWSKTGLTDATPELRGSVPVASGEKAGSYTQPAARYWGASGLAGVWSESNTRDDLYDAMRRRETFATSGPRIPVRFFAGFELPADLPGRADSIALAYQKAVPMGGDLLARGAAAPAFFVWAARAPDSAPLQRIQIVKGWMADGESREQVYDVACSGGASPDPGTYRCPDNGAKVDVTTCEIDEARGAAELGALWRDPGFDPAQRAVYYARVLENPTCRWSTWDALRAGAALRPDLPAVIQERAWSSPIWFEPSGA